MHDSGVSHRQKEMCLESCVYLLNGSRKGFSLV